jgi:hypothetical protein
MKQDLKENNFRKYISNDSIYNFLFSKKSVNVTWVRWGTAGSQKGSIASLEDNAQPLESVVDSHGRGGCRTGRKLLTNVSDDVYCLG